MNTKIIPATLLVEYGIPWQSVKDYAVDFHWYEVDKRCLRRYKRRWRERQRALQDLFQGATVVETGSSLGASRAPNLRRS